MNNQIDIGRLRRGLLAFATAGAFAIGIASALLGVAPLYGRLQGEVADGVAEAARSSSQAIYAVVAGRHQVARQLSGRTRARVLLESYLNGRLGAGAAGAETETILADAMAMSDDVRGVLRVARDGTEIGAVGETVSRESWPAGWASVDTVIAEGPVVTDRGLRVVLAAPILGVRGDRIGTDIILADASPIAARLAASKRKEGGSTRVFLLHTSAGQARLLLADESVEPLDGRARLPVEWVKASHAGGEPALVTTDEVIVAVAPVGINGWSVLVRRDAAEVYAGLNHELAMVALAVLGLALAGAGGVYLLLRPVTGNMLVVAESLEKAVADATTEADLARRRAEAAQKVAEAAYRELQRTQETLIQAEKMASLGGLVAGVAHEINTPVGIVLTGASYLQAETDKLKHRYESDDLTAEDMEGYLAAAAEASALIQSNAVRAADLIQSFKQVAVDQTAGERRVVTLKAYVGEVLTSLTPKLKKRPVTVRVDIPPDLEVDTFPGALSQVLTNLVVNSLTHGFEPDRAGTIAISARLDHAMVELCYRDDGKGIPPEHHKKVFDPFFTTRRDAGGSGLGLNILYNLVTRTLGGGVTLDTTTEKGCAFILRFPRSVTAKVEA